MSEREKHTNDLLAELDYAVDERELSCHPRSASYERERACRQYQAARIAIENALAARDAGAGVMATAEDVIAFMNRERRDRGVRNMSAEKEMLVRRTVALAHNGATNMAIVNAAAAAGREVTVTESMRRAAFDAASDGLDVRKPGWLAAAVCDRALPAAFRALAAERGGGSVREGGHDAP